MARVHRIGSPENASETRAIKHLAAVLPDDYMIFHNFELTTGRGLPYEYDVAVVGEFAVWHVEVKGYRGTIQGDQHQWIFPNGHVQPSPIPLANKKSKILAGKLKRHSRQLEEVWVDTAILLTDARARVRIRDEQASRVILLGDALDRFTDPSRIPVRVSSIDRHHDAICEALFGAATPRRKVGRIGLYDILERINQTETRTVFLAEHRYIRTRPRTILKVFHFDVYTSEEEKRRQIEAIFRDQDAMRLLGAHPNLIQTGDMFAWDDDKFVLPTEYVDNGRPLAVLLEEQGDRPVSWSQKADLVAKLAAGLGHAHSRNVIHRDVRPMNVVVAPGGVVKLVNFDLARIRSAPHPHAGRRLLNRFDRRYVAPEVWTDPVSATESSDIYSLGVLLYELITGRCPYPDIEEVLEAGDETPLDRELLRSELATPGSEDFMASPDDAVAVIERMLSRDPAARHGSVAEVVEDLSILRDD